MRRFLLKLPIRARRLLLIDSLGAATTSLVMLFLLASQWIQTGLPSTVLYGLAIAGTVLCAVGGYAFVRRQNPIPTLRFLAFANALYCVAAATICLVYRERVTGLGTLYFSVEIAIILALVVVELSVAARESRPH